ncbi:hypothetical protein AMS68_005210 [Peltaster fructicola]|uniref:Peptidase A1 domain-containing protein n=1 Tax=Peltaster fructicola TaxID=286661 RepID=A0A6H0XY63_9PEZI|nr:hypothetical protein AMS68_005210 [Peltaster fructicola]
MHFTSNFLVALLATSALAAPAPKKEHKLPQLAAFKVPSRARPNHNKNVDTYHEMSRAYAKFNLDLVLAKPLAVSPVKTHQARTFNLNLNIPTVELSTPVGDVDVPNVPQMVDNLLDGILPESKTKTSTKSAKQTTKPAKKTSTAAAVTSAAPPPRYSPASSYIAPPPVTTSSAETPISLSAAAESYAQSEPSVVVVSAVPETTSYVPETSYAAETSFAPESSAAAPATSSAAPETSSEAQVSSATPETSSAAPVSSYIPETSAAVPVSSAAPETSSAAAVTSSAAPTTLSTVIQPSFTFAPTTTEAFSTTAPASSTSQKVAATVQATPEQNQSEYLAPVTVGGQALTLNFDTGSADFWVFGSSLPATQYGTHTSFDSSKSSTWQSADGYTWKISYGDGSTASGTVGFDAVTIGGATATRQAVEVATQVSDTFAKDAANDGLVGLGWSSINTIKPTAQKTFFENIMADLQQPLFTADLRKDASGSYEFGTIDAAKYSGDIHYTGIDNSKGFWQFASTSYTINGQTYQNANAAPAIADTGTSIVLADNTAVSAYYNQVTGASVSSTAGGWIFPCSATLPEYGVAIGDSGFVATIPGSEMVYADLKDGTCFGGLQSNTGINYQIFGDVLLKQYFAVFNGGAKTFGIAKKA